MASNSDFPRFKVVDDGPPSDHHYLKHASKSGLRMIVSPRMKEEWRRLESDLPESIFVRGYKTQNCLLRAAIVGSEATPYHNCLFFFDIFLPSEYPGIAPEIHYHCFKLQINPRLSYFSTGEVSLSLLNTQLPFRWNRTIFIIQVLLAIQTLVSDVKPYFLDRPLSRHRWKALYKEDAEKYDEKVYVRCCKLTLYLVQQPLMGFEPLVTTHFRERAVEILTTCNKYRLASVGTSVEIDDGFIILVSSKYKSFIEDVYASLIAAFFARYGDSVEDFVKELADERAALEKEGEEDKSSIRMRFERILVTTGLRKQKCLTLGKLSK